MAVKARRSERTVKPSTRVERAHWGDGRTLIVGADAVGVACLSGPVLAAAVAMPPFARRIPGVRDSKMLSRAQRERLFPLIMRRALAVGIGAASVAEIDRINIYHATVLAMRRALARLETRLETSCGQRPNHVLVDGNPIRTLGYVHTAIVKGDARCYNIACASIIAKVTRDRLMRSLAARYDGYGWSHNVGYGTREHRRALDALGLTPHHRKRFCLDEQTTLGLDVIDDEMLEEVLDGPNT